MPDPHLPVFRARPALTGGFRLAEGPLWDAPRERLLWVDVEEGRVFEGRMRPDGTRVEVVRGHGFAGTVGAVACADDGRLLVAGRHALTVLTAAGTRLPGPRVLPPGTPGRLNDGGCDPAGRFLAGSTAPDGVEGRDILARIGDDGAVALLDTDLTCSNGPAWSADGRRMYSVDTVPGVVRVRAYDPADGTVGERRDFLRITGGLPDGLCVDEDGNVWVAVWGAGEVRCYSPAAEHLATVRVPAARTSSVAMAGPGLDTMVITAAGPDGGVFTARTGARGVPLAPWNGRGRPRTRTPDATVDP
ncbi:SMP-30/gluconolactonase/LRE family protein [Streptomyces sp. NBC_01477]|uniref:SMP-30/gluconolactonase/LRE family protein n=1 Tax=Streptomyces sp. NBC_01477 TaxID=2976015 RepID=UPI002E374C6D|nr:SMP-30/gluconolactonase/LRE family protein [Streptomyces sp. NBC_01477]